ncbi:phosphate acetyltransferase [Campylobacter sp. CCS1377]|uniref:Phosphate acetyltransferase n=1 Tax=Campylobacter sp. CCS1377 TaxID=3158229 RepID=A0AAU7E3X9_9BACT
MQFYLIQDKEKSVSQKFLDYLEKKYSSVNFYSVVVSDLLKTLSSKHKISCSFETQNQAFELYNTDQNAFFNKILQDFEKFKKENSCVVVLGLNEFGVLGTLELNVKFAKEFNAFIVVDCEILNKIMLSNYLKNALKNENFAFVDENLNLPEKSYQFTTPSRFRYELICKAKQNKKTIVLPESDDERILKASEILLKSEVVNLILLGDENEIKEKCKVLNLNITGAQILNPKNSIYNDEFAKTLYEARKAKGMSEEEAKKLVCDRTYYGTLLVHTAKADAMVSGASTTTAETVRPALQLIKTKQGVSLVSGVFFMCLEDKVLVFADCAVTPNPTPEQIAEIAYVSANTAKSFGIDPKVALLSYSSGDSGSGPSVDAIKEAFKIATERYKDLKIEAPIQFDAAYDEKTGKSKMPNSEVAGKANVYIFPDLNAANICYKAVQRTANALAVGPVLQGLKKPVNDLSRGCLIDDVVNTVILSAIQAE